MKSKFLLVAALTGCVAYAAPTTRELVAARQTYSDARQSAAAAEAPRALASAHNMLVQAEHVHTYAPGSQREREVAYLALRQAQTAIAEGNARAGQRAANARAVRATQEANAAKAQAQYESQQRQRAEQDAASARMTLEQTEAALAEVRRQLAIQGTTITAQTQQLQQQEATLQAQVDAMRSERDRAQGERDAAIGEMRRLGALAERVDRSLVLTMPGEVMFRVNEATLLPRAKEKLNELATALQTLGSDQQFRIEGYADASGTEAYNRELSQQRADAVRTYLIARGIDGERIRAVGHGENEPVASNTNPEGRANNRRVEIVVSPAAVSRR